MSSQRPPGPEPFRLAPSFHKVEDTGSFVPGDFEKQYEELFAEALSEGPITPEERERLDLAADALRIDAARVQRLERALLAAYEARAAITNADSVAPDSLAEREASRPRQASIPELADEERAVDTPPSAPPVIDEAPPPPARAPEAPAPRDELRERFAAGDADERFRVASVLVQRGAATAEERAYYDAHRPRAPIRPTRPLTTRAWEQHLLHPEEDRLTGEIFAVIASAALLGRVTALRRDRAMLHLAAEHKQDPATSTVSATRAVAWAAATLGLKPPAIYLAPDVDSGMDCVAALPPALRVGARMLRGQSAIQLAFHAARVLTWFRSEHFVCTLVPHLDYLEDLFLAALRIGAPHLPMPPPVVRRVDVVKNAILPVLEPAQIASLRFHVSAFIDRGGRTSLRAWARAAELTASRAGLLLCGDLPAACAVVQNEAHGADRVKDLEAFWLDPDCAALRAQLGVALT